MLRMILAQLFYCTSPHRFQEADSARCYSARCNSALCMYSALCNHILKGLMKISNYS